MLLELSQAIHFIQDIILEFFDFPFPGLPISVGWLFLSGIAFLFVFRIFKVLFSGGDI